MILPLEVTPQDPTKAVGLRLKLGYAICEKLCVPAEAKLFCLPQRAYLPSGTLRRAANYPDAADSAELPRQYRALPATKIREAENAQTDNAPPGPSTQSSIFADEMAEWLPEAPGSVAVSMR